MTVRSPAAGARAQVRAPAAEEGAAAGHRTEEEEGRSESAQSVRDWEAIARVACSGLGTGGDNDSGWTI